MSFTPVEKKANNLYKVLGVDRNASSAEIEKAYKERIKKVAGDEDEKREVQKAYEVLSNKEKRQAYDKGEEDESGDAPEDIQRILEMLGGGSGAGASRKSKPKRPRMKPMQFALEVSLDDIYSGTTSKMRVTRMRICKSCSG